MKLVDALVTTLRDWNLEYIFGVSGANIEHLHDSVHRLGDGKLEAILTKSEVGAAFMADARARVHGTLGVCCSTSGGGMMNLAVGIAESYAESVPVLALVGQTATNFDGRGGFQDSSGLGRTVHATAMWQSMSKYTARVDDPNLFWNHLENAVRQSLSGRRGPSVLLFPRDIYDLEVGPRPEDFPTNLQELMAPEFTVEASELNDFLETIRNAKNPVMMIGTGVSRCNSPEHVIQFAMEAGIPVVTTMGNTGAFPHEHELFLGAVGVAGHPSAHHYLNEETDLLIAVGTGLNIMTRGPLEKCLTHSKVIGVNLDPFEIKGAVPNAQVIQSDAGEVFRHMRDLFYKHSFHHGKPDDYLLRRFVPQFADAETQNAVPENALLQSQAISLIQDYLPENGNVLFDAGNCAATSMHHLKIPDNASTTIALGMGGMGYAIAAACGAQLGQEDTRSMVLCGDGAFLMLGFEIHTAVELGLPILFVVFNNQKHGMCVTRQEIFFEGRKTCTDYGQLNVESIARGLGPEQSLWTGQASTQDELSALLEEYHQGFAQGPGVLELHLPYEEVPPFTPFLDKGAETYVVPTPLKKEAKLAIEDAA
jgi:acetolactate synthase I/II/III large subunit